MNKKTLALGQIFAGAKNNAIFIKCTEMDLLGKVRLKKLHAGFSGSLFRRTLCL